jgi:hypothetical protein
MPRSRTQPGLRVYDDFSQRLAIRLGTEMDEQPQLAARFSNSCAIKPISELVLISTPCHTACILPRSKARLVPALTALRKEFSAAGSPYTLPLTTSRSVHPTHLCIFESFKARNVKKYSYATQAEVELQMAGNNLNSP